jgi:hypothetical protein
MQKNTCSRIYIKESFQQDQSNDSYDLINTTPSICLSNIHKKAVSENTHNLIIPYLFSPVNCTGRCSTPIYSIFMLPRCRPNFTC